MTDNWRPFESSKDEAKRIEDDRDRNRCNLHDDCAAADASVAAKGGRMDRDGFRHMHAFHCSSDNCEDCFGC